MTKSLPRQSNANALVTQYPAQVITGPSKHASVWLAFSRHRWTADVLKATQPTGRCRKQAHDKTGCHGRSKRFA